MVFFGIKPPAEIRIPQKVIFAGYSHDFKRSEEAGVDYCEILDRLKGQGYGHNCSMTPGASGGPLFTAENGHYFVVGVNTRGMEDHIYRTYNPDVANISVWSNALYEKLHALRRVY